MDGKLMRNLIKIVKMYNWNYNAVMELIKKKIKREENLYVILRNKHIVFEFRYL
jgi:UDP-N-acetyl-D-mannosaminuronic acid transferase (WecB/TagA/CpsF family)